MGPTQTLSPQTSNPGPGHTRHDDAEATLRDNQNPKTQKDLLDWFRHAPLRMPRTQPELFRLLATYNPRFGWDAFAETIDFAGVTPREICQVVLGRHPGSVEEAMPRPDYNARMHFRAALISREFRKRFIGA